MLNNKSQRNQKFFSNASFTSNLKAQVGTTITWMVATLVIVVVLLISIYVSSLLSKTKDFSSGDFDTEDLGYDSLAKKSMFAFLLTNSQGENIVYSQLNNEKDLSEFNENLAFQIFGKIFGEEFHVGVGINKDINYIESNYLGKQNQEEFLEKIQLKNNNELNLVLEGR